MRLVEPILSFQTELEAIRRDLHAHPELCYEEQRTADVVAARLEEWGIPVVRGLGKTGVVGIVKNGTVDARDRPARRHGCAADAGTQHI